MSAADKDPDKHSADADPPLTVELLADLQAGLLDDATAARIRSRVRSDPQAQQILRALNRVRRDVAAMGADPAWGPAARPAVVDSISAALRFGAPEQLTRRRSRRPSARPPRPNDRRRGRIVRRGHSDRCRRRGRCTATRTECTDNRAAHHGVKTCPGDSAVSAAGSRPASPHPGLWPTRRPAGRSVPAYVLPERPRLSGVHAGAGRAADRYRRSARRTAGDTRGHARQTGRFCGRAALQRRRYRVVG